MKLLHLGVNVRNRSFCVTPATAKLQPPYGNYCSFVRQHFAYFTSFARYFTYEDAEIGVKPCSIYPFFIARREAEQIVHWRVPQSFLTFGA